MHTSRFRSQNLRIGRYSAAGQIYLITTVTRNRMPIFNSLRNGRCVVRALREAEISTNTLAYVVMPDHLHWLMQLKEGYDLSQVMQFVKCTSSRALNSFGCAQSSVWSKGFYDRALRTEDDIRACARYVVANPLRAGIVDSVRNYSLWDAVWL